MASRAKKHTQGRRKIEIKKIQNEEARSVTFSKRKVELFKKVSELSILCGAESTAVVFSPTGRPYSFGHPSIDSIANRYFNAGPKLEIESPASTAMVAILNNDLNKKLDDLKIMVEKLRKRKKVLEEELKRTEVSVKSNVDRLRGDELREYERRLLELIADMGKQTNRLMMRSNGFGVAESRFVNLDGFMQPFVPSENAVLAGERGCGGGYIQHGNHLGGGYIQHGNHLGGGGGAGEEMCYGNNAFPVAFQ